MPNPALLLLMTFAASPAAAASIEKIAPQVVAEPASIVSLGCPACKPLVAPTPSVAAPSHLATGEQILTLGQRDGKPVLMRTEAWMGGSPVTFVSVNPVWIDRETQALVLRAEPTGMGHAPEPQDPVDNSTTSALPPEPAGAPLGASASVPSQPLQSPPDFSGVALRPTR
jgi:hypothetical protein